jgi:hypothetical protein
MDNRASRECLSCPFYRQNEMQQIPAKVLQKAKS